MNPRLSMKEQVLRLREDAIVVAVHRLLATKGYDAMTVDEVAAEAGIAKASLYKHFTSKQELAGAAMVRVLDVALAMTEGLRQRAAEQEAPGQPLTAIAQLEAVARWAVQSQLDGEMPTLPSQDSALVESLKANDAYTDRLLALSNQLGIWITQAQTGGEIAADLPAEMVLFSLFALACDPVVAMLKSSGQYRDDQIVGWVTNALFGGLRPR
jgi:AcrR family transcriptional regulator